MIVENCPHCQPDSAALADVLQATRTFWVVCDHYPLTEGHILIIPKEHLSCAGAYSESLSKEFQALYYKVGKFLKHSFGSVSSFEHGVIGQTVFHSHFHLLPFKGLPLKIVPEGEQYFSSVKGIEQLPEIFKKETKYLFFSIQEQNWIVNTKIGAPRFFRDRFAIALGDPIRGNWKQMSENQELMQQAGVEREKLKVLWNDYFKI